MKDALIENLAGMCSYKCRTLSGRSDYCTVCEAAERLKEAETEREARQQVAAAFDSLQQQWSTLLDERNAAIEARQQAEREREALWTALETVTENMDRAGGDNSGMPECPWCRSGPDGNDHAGNCELAEAREVLAALSAVQARETTTTND